MVEKLDRAVNLRFPASLYDHLAREAKRSGRKLSDHIRFVLQQGLAIEGKGNPRGNVSQRKHEKNQLAELKKRIKRLERLVQSSRRQRDAR